MILVLGAGHLEEVQKEAAKRGMNLIVLYQIGMKNLIKAEKIYEGIASGGVK